MSTEFSPESKPAGLPTAVTEDAPASKASALFDLRVLIGGLFTFYGVLLLVAGLRPPELALRGVVNRGGCS